VYCRGFSPRLPPVPIFIERGGALRHGADCHGFSCRRLKLSPAAPGRSGIGWFPVGRFYTREELVAARAEWKRAGKIVVFTNGCYDILHPGHVRLLERARSLGDLLILALNTDSSVRRLKGPNRPLISEPQRAELVAALQAVDAVTFFDEDTPRELIAAVLPDILVKGADWAHWIAGREEVEAAGGQVLALSLEPGYSTTGIVEEILSRKP
jgi:D-glycero-beta-D-manno-heptose 1-phosphate adenylyltransferase